MQAWLSCFFMFCWENMEKYFYEISIPGIVKEIIFRYNKIQVRNGYYGRRILSKCGRMNTEERDRTWQKGKELSE